MTQTATPRYYTLKSQVPLGAGEGLYFTAGKGYHAGPEHPLRAGTFPPTDLQSAQNQVATTIDPVAAAYKTAAAQSSTSQAQAIKDATSSLATLMGQYAPTAQGAYTGAAAGQAAVDAATAATRQGQGADAEAELAAKLAAIHADPGTAARISGGQSANLAGEAQAAAARGSASLSSLLAGGAHAADFGAKLPGVAGAMGLQALQQSEGQISSKLADQLSALEAQRPGAVQAALAQIQSQRTAAAKAAADAQQRAFDNRFKVGQANEKIDEFNASQALTGQKLQLQAGHYSDLSAQAWAKIGISDKSLQLRAKALDQKQANDGFSAGQLNTFHSNAYGIAQDSLNGYVDAKGNQVAPRSYQDAFDWMIRSHVPPAIATQTLNATYPETRKPVTASTRADYAQTTGQIPNLEPLSQKYGLDPRAVMAVAAQEGLGGGVGDSGTSFGPFQLHVGGALPAEIAAKGPDYAQHWAWSQAGIDYALRHIAKVASGLTGPAAISAIVRGFERPANAPKEIAGASSYYGRG